MGSISTLNGTSLWRLYYSAPIFGLSPRHWHGGEGVPKYVVFDVRSILGVQISSENFSLYTNPVGLRKFSRKVTTAKLEFLTTWKPICSKTGTNWLTSAIVPIADSNLCRKMLKPE